MEHHFIDRYAELDSPVHRWDVRVKTAFFFCAVVVFVSTPTDAYARFAAFAAVVFAALLASRLPLLFFAKRLAIVMPFIAAVGFFHLFSGKPWGERLALFGGLCMKSMLAVSALILLISTTRFARLLEALEAFGVPQVFIKTFAFAYRYIFLLQDELMRMARAARARNFAPKHLFQVHKFGWIIGSFFIRSYERAERVYLAMLARGFAGRFARSEPAPIRWSDATAGIASIAALVLIRSLPL